MKSRTPLPRAPRSKWVPFRRGEDWRDRHQRRLEHAEALEDQTMRALAERGLDLRVRRNPACWCVYDPSRKMLSPRGAEFSFVVAEWWPQSGRFVAAKDYDNPCKYHDVHGFLTAVESLLSSKPDAT